jgi:hypothetical protein
MNVTGARPSSDAAASANRAADNWRESWLAGNVAAPGTGALRAVRTNEIRASDGMRVRSKLQPIQPARRAVGDNGLRLMMADGGKAKWGTSRRLRTVQVVKS